eukprot:8050619-Lingulodinium_polyedra.AAC.1
MRPVSRSATALAPRASAGDGDSTFAVATTSGTSITSAPPWPRAAGPAPMASWSSATPPCLQSPAACAAL